MFTQVYFHKTRVAYDVHLRGALKQILPGGTFPKPTGQELQSFLSWDDWRVLGELAAGAGGEHGERLRTRNHFRRIYATNEICNEDDLNELERVKDELGALIVAEESASKSWHKTGNPDIAVVQDYGGRVRPLSQYSSVIANLKSNNQVQLYVKPENVAAGQKLIEKVVKKRD